MSTETAGPVAAPRRPLRRTIRFLDALTGPHGVDRYIELVRPTWSSTEVRGRVVALHRTTADTVTLTIHPNRNWAGFEPGQHTELTVDIDGVRHTRCYSMADSPAVSDRGGPEAFELTVKAHPEGRVSRFLVDHARVGMVVGLSQAQGEFVLPSVRPPEIVLISGGSGITPVMSMLRTLCEEGYAGTVTFVHYALTEASMIYRRELAELAAANPNVSLVRIFTDAPGTGDLDGFLDTEQLDRAAPAWRTAETFVCGPEPLMDAARGIFAAAGCAERFHTEAFTLPQFVAEAGGVDGSLHFGATGATVTNDGRPVLLQAEDAGLAPRSGCRMGICHTCVRTLNSGTVRNAVTGEMTSEAGVDVRICVNVPVGDVEIDL